MYERILVPVDGSSTSNRGLDEAIKLARLAGARIRVIHVIDELVVSSGFETGATYLKDVLPKLKADGEAVLSKAKDSVAAARVPVEGVLLECFATTVAEMVVKQAEEWKADLIVIGTHGRRGLRRLMMGSDAEQIVRGSRVPVLLVPEPVTRKGAGNAADLAQAAETRPGREGALAD
jgi:nucleotide-binding universal stress UspA family protein